MFNFLVSKELNFFSFKVAKNTFSFCSLFTLPIFNENKIFFLFSNFLFIKITFLSFFYVNIILIFCWRDVIREPTYLRFHTEIVKTNFY